MTAAGPSTERERGAGHALTPEQRRERTRLGIVAAIAVLLTAFALLNLDRVKVHWIVTTGSTPLIVVIVVAFALGIAADRILLYRGKRKRAQAADAQPPRPPE